MTKEKTAEQKIKASMPKHVRLTSQAHLLLSGKAEDYKTSMKAVASEAIFLMVQGEDRDKEQQNAIEIYEKRTAILAKRIQDNRHAAFGTFVLGAAVAGCLGIIIGGML